MTTRSRRALIAILVVACAAGVVAYAFRSRIFRPRSTMPAAASPAPASAPEAQTPRAAVDIDPRRQQMIGVRTVEAKRQPLSQTIRTVGVVKYDETRQADVNVKVEGWIRELFVDYTGQSVQRGQPLFTLNSPQVLTS